jgi:hypothetical protein
VLQASDDGRFAWRASTSILGQQIYSQKLVNSRVVPKEKAQGDRLPPNYMRGHHYGTIQMACKDGLVNLADIPD